MYRLSVLLLTFTLLLVGCGQPVEEGLLFRTADPGLNITFLIPDAPGAEVGTAPPCTEVKGNISQDGRKLYHEPGMRNYNQTKINEAAGERCFATSQEAEAAGWVRAGN